MATTRTDCPAAMSAVAVTTMERRKDGAAELRMAGDRIVWSGEIRDVLCRIGGR